MIKKIESSNLPKNQDNKFLIDWFSFTSKVDSDNSILEVLGLSHFKDAFQVTYGFHGYKTRLYFDGISIHYCHSKNQGVWVEMSGQGCRNFETYSTITFDELFKVVLYNQDNEDYHITRLDVAYDDFEKVIPLKKLADQILKEQFTTKFSSKSCMASIHPGYHGITCDLGSRQSEVKFRVYDKAYERKFFKEIEEDSFTWTRWEIQLRNDRATSFLVQSLENGVGNVFKGVIINLFRVVDVNKNDSHKDRWKTSKWFDKFIGNVEKVSVFTPCKTDYNLYKLERYVYTQAGNAVDTLIQIKGLDNFVAELKASKSETTPKYKELLNTYKASQEVEENRANILKILEENGLN